MAEERSLTLMLGFRMENPRYHPGRREGHQQRGREEDPGNKVLRKSRLKTLGRSSFAALTPDL